MAENYTLLLLSQHFPNSQKLRIISYDDVSVDADVADFLQSAEQQASQQTLERIKTFAFSRGEKTRTFDPLHPMQVR